MSRQSSKGGKRTNGAPGFGAKFGGSRGFAGFGSSTVGSDLAYVSEPPDFSSISDPQVVVSFKNLLKKDSITKAKGLDDFLTYVRAHPYEQDGGPEEAILEAWVQLYPKTSIDNSRRVRELAHTVQFELMRSARKRMERLVPKVVGPWLAGLYDRDRLVSTVVNNNISTFLNSPVKITMFWKKCQQQILQFATGAIRETKDTLSDDRSTTPEDSEAKYFRVLGAALSLVLGLLQKLSDDDIEKYEEDYLEFITDDVVWKCVNIGDSSVRKTACQLLSLCLESRKSALEEKLPRIQKTLVTDGLKSNHVGSVVELLNTLMSFTQSFPTIWLPSRGDKKAPVTRLSPFVEKGSQGSKGGFWEGFEALIKVIPSEVITLDVANSIARSMRAGISSREEPRSQAAVAWTRYLRVSRYFLGVLSSGDDQVNFAAESLLPLLEHYLHPGSPDESSNWVVPGSSASAVIEGCYAVTTESAPEAVISASKEKWRQLSADYCSRIANSLPEVSRDYEKSQESIAEEGARWFTLIGQVQRTKAQSSKAGYDTALDEPAAEIVGRCVDIFSRRNLKPFGAAKTLRHMAESTMYLSSNAQITDTLFELLLESGSEQMDLVLTARSRLDLVFCLQAFADKESSQYERLWKAWTASLLNDADDPAVPEVIEALISYEKAGQLAQGDSSVQDYILKHSLRSLTSESANWSLLEKSLKYGALTRQSQTTLTNHLLDVPQDNSTTVEKALDALTIMERHGGDIMSGDEDLRLALVTKLLSLSEADGTSVSSKASDLRQLIGSHAEWKKSTRAILQNNLKTAGPESLEIDTLIRLAAQELQTNPNSLEDILPNPSAWLHELSVATSDGINPSLSITSSLGGAQFLVRASSEASAAKVTRDRSGRSVPARMGLYTANLVEELIDLQSLPEGAEQSLTDTITLLLVTAQMASDQLTMMEPGGFFAEISPGNLPVVDNLVSTTLQWVNQMVTDSTGWVGGEGDKPGQLVSEVLKVLLRRSRDTTPLAFYCAKAASEIIQALTAKHGPPADFEELLSSSLPSKEIPSAIFPAVALLSGVGELPKPPHSLNTLCNRLVSDAAGAKPTSETALATLVMLTCCLGFYQDKELPVQMNRLVFAVKNVTGWFEAEDPVDPFFAAESCRLLTRLLPRLSAVYGSHWESTLEFCTKLWESADEFPADIMLPAIHASVKLYATLESLPEPNDDLEDALKDAAESKALTLIDLLKLPRESESSPQGIVDSLLCRQVEKTPLRLVKDLSDIYGLLASESRDIQAAAFTLMHKALPAIQEQLSVDVLLDKTNAHLPEELLSLLLDPPTLEKYPDNVLSQFPTTIRSYLLTWHLIFDSYSTASLNVRNDYTEDLKSGSYIGPLMDFIFDVLGHSAAHALNLEREGLAERHRREYDIKLAGSDTDERDMHWLMVHVLFLCLKYVPELFKGWFIDCRSKQTRIAVEPWMAKYFSPLIVADALDDVAEWAEAQEAPGDEEKELMVKVSKAAREVVAKYEVDEDMAAITIRVPASYPIEGIVVEGTSRVVVDERTWQSWVRTTQGVITFSNGSIIDGLMAFRRNIVGALKGQTECAICYAIIASDKKMPDKRCGTCRNLFHRQCLYKWFQTSSQNTCPLCRNPIDYLGSDTRARRGGQGQ
ncbi:uncharacterized protein DNG_01473 [Cephalotrichum gorgonifer]|uniref:E3 ubiquitin-protein ligase listerin n=1 Tax=Cephalotrichum gorgonifer TaxID=2041049 RepID=A0AAE8MRZ7_9PEZI|nr:uncharacterized protein DNG_01473 [Cephalotrichum gorgonifer]